MLITSACTVSGSSSESQGQFVGATRRGDGSFRRCLYLVACLVFSGIELCNTLSMSSSETSRKREVEATIEELTGAFYGSIVGTCVANQIARLPIVGQCGYANDR